MRQRLVYIDTAKCLAIWLVLWGHAITELMPQNLAENPVYVGIYSFHMPLFMLISGMFAGRSFSLNIKELIKKKFKQLILPTLLFFGITWYIIDPCIIHNSQFIIHNSSAESNEVTYYNEEIFIKDFIKHELSCYWFLKSLFLCYIAGWICWRGNKYKWTVALVLLIFSLLVQQWDFSIFKFGYMWPFFLFGIFIKERLEWLKKHTWAIFIVSAIVFAIGYFHYSLEYSFQAKLFKEISFHSCLGYTYYLVMGLSGSMMVLTICMKVPQRELICKIGTTTLGIYLWQKILLELLLPHFVQVNMSMEIYNWLFTPFIATISLIAIYWIAVLTKRLKLY